MENENKMVKFNMDEINEFEKEIIIINENINNSISVRIDGIENQNNCVNKQMNEVESADSL